MAYLHSMAHVYVCIYIHVIFFQRVVMTLLGAREDLMCFGKYLQQPVKS